MLQRDAKRCTRAGAKMHAEFSADQTRGICLAIMLKKKAGSR
jgi:hypothetical protein